MSLREHGGSLSVIMYPSLQSHVNEPSVSVHSLLVGQVLISRHSSVSVEGERGERGRER